MSYTAAAISLTWEMADTFVSLFLCNKTLLELRGGGDIKSSSQAPLGSDQAAGSSSYKKDPKMLVKLVKTM